MAALRHATLCTCSIRTMFAVTERKQSDVIADDPKQTLRLNRWLT